MQVVTSLFCLCQSFLLLSKREIVILVTFNLLSANAFSLVISRILLFGKGLYVTQHIKFVFHRMETILEKGENA